MQKYNQHKNVKVYDKNANNVEQDSSVGSRELDFMVNFIMKLATAN